MPRVEAIIWDYFKVSECKQHFAICQDCKNEVSRGGSTVKTFNTNKQQTPNRRPQHDNHTPLQGAMIRHHLAKYGSALLNC